ncbi:MAG: hypothetical protein CEN89_456 [Candidatus Berkelbacteria bacterium Licking1014_7]|uniref:Uncharacterized protein n=1 Tax=Candidatus Berkelbacteria bacterium Licking1014_7 TaxID=2017147 RepID=A0A554LIS1_9BACT|nr:MAG: hypothetical protein CEN89_456 [Candidatus Berkelbacteria bacterium Licking1014_7]
MKRFQKGFTLLEILLVLAIIAILAAVVIVAINPTKQLNTTRDAQRASDISTIASGIGLGIVDGKTKPTVTATTEATAQDICKKAQVCTGGVILDTVTVDSLPQGVPFDPTASTTTTTGYKIYTTATESAYTIVATKSDGTTISITK